MTTLDLTAQFKQQAQAALSLNIAYIGIVNGLFSALFTLKTATAQQLAQYGQMDPQYVVRWCDAAFAFGYLEDTPEGFMLAPSGTAMCPDSPNTLMPMAIQSVLSAHMAERSAELMRTGERPGESVLAERSTVLPWFGPMLEANFANLFEHSIIPDMPVFSEINERYGLVVDLGCGNGWYLRTLLRHFSHLRGFGVDGFAENIQQATTKTLAQGLNARLTFQPGDIHHIQLPEPADLIVMNRALHHVWEKDPDGLIRWMAQQLKPQGYALIWEPAWPAERQSLRQPALRAMAFQNLTEHVQGNHFLHPEEIQNAFSRHGFSAEVKKFNQGMDAIIMAKKLSA